MIQPPTQTRQYWEHQFAINDSDIDFINTHFLEIESPQSTAELTLALMRHRVQEEMQALRRKVRGCKLYHPAGSYTVGDKVAFPLLDFESGEVTDIREGYNPDVGDFNVITVTVNKRERTFAAELKADHAASINSDGDADLAAFVKDVSADDLYSYYGTLVEPKVEPILEGEEEFVILGGQWFPKALLADVNEFHLNLAEAALFMFEGGPQTTPEIVGYLELDTDIKKATQVFSLNYALLNDGRFDEIAPKNHVAWFLRQMEPEDVAVVPHRLAYKPIEYDRAVLSPQLRRLELEIADEWSGLEATEQGDSVTISLNYPHRATGSLPLNSSVARLLPLGRSPRQLFTIRDVVTGEEMRAWVVKEGRYIFGLKEWYEAHEIVVGTKITIKPDESDPHVILVDYGRHKPRTMDIRLATVTDGRIKFELERRKIGCEYDELLAVGTEYIAAIDAVWTRVNSANVPLVGLLAAITPELAQMSPQQSVHSKTLYSIINMLRRVPPGPIFTELIRHPAFVLVGDVGWQFEKQKWRGR